jgi:oxygen-independent coproporphyrinogen-3 oxidase
MCVALTLQPPQYFADLPPGPLFNTYFRSSAIPEDDTAYAMLDQITEMTVFSGMQRYE